MVIYLDKLKEEKWAIVPWSNFFKDKTKNGKWLTKRDEHWTKGVENILY